MQDLKVVLAIDNKELRGRLSTALQSAGFSPGILDSSFAVRGIETDETLVILETDNDVAALTQAVYELYMKANVDYTLPIIGILSLEALENNPSVGLWNIGGHAAIICLLRAEEPDLERIVLIFIERLSKANKDENTAMTRQG